MNEEIDVRGLSCTEPVIRVRKKLLKLEKGTVRVLVDTTGSKDNIVRMARNMGWKIEVTEKNGEYIVIIRKL